MTQIKLVNNGDLLRDIMPRSFSHLFDSMLNENFAPASLAQRPLADISESEDAYFLQIALAGYSKENIKIEQEDNKLRISGELKSAAENTEEKKPKYHLREIKLSNFSRTFSLPKNADTEKIEAEFSNGILSISIPKSETNKYSRNIAIK